MEIESVPSRYKRDDIDTLLIAAQLQLIKNQPVKSGGGVAQSRNTE